MIAVLLNWIYIFITTFLLGEFILKRVYLLLDKRKSLSCMSCLITGIVAATVYAEYFSLLAGVGTAANLIMIIICIVFAVIDRKDIFTMIKSNVKYWWMFIGVAGIALLCVYFTAYGDFTYDTGLYHAQSIHWIESYGVVKGLGYVHQRFAYNSSFLCLSALYSMKDLLGGTSLHTVSGFVAVICVSYSFLGFVRGLVLKKKVLRPSNFIRLGAPLYLLVILPEVISPGTDYTTVFFIMYLTLRWMELAEEKEKSSTPYALLCVLAVFLMSFKLSAGAMVILVIKPAYILIKEKKWKQIAAYILLGVISILPYFVRTVLISGWLLYPYAAIDLFDFDWKLSLETIAGDAEEIKLWARLTYEGQYLNQTLTEWFPIWWERQGSIARNYTMAAIAGGIIGGVHLITETIQAVKNKNWEWFEYAYLNIVLFISILFWLLSAPSHRFGYSFLLMVPLCAVGTLFYRRYERKYFYVFPAAACVAIGVLLAASTWSHIGDDIACVRNTLNRDYLMMQRDYPRGDVHKTTVDGMEIYCPAEPSGQTWYYDFPAANDEANLKSWKLRTGKIEDGFCPVEKISPYRE